MLDLGNIGATSVNPETLQAGEVVKFDVVELDGGPVFAGLSMLVNELHTVHPNGKKGIEGNLLYGCLLDESAQAITSSPRARNVNGGGLYAAIWHAKGAEAHEIQFYRHPMNIQGLTTRW